MRTLADELAAHPHGPTVRLLPAGEFARGSDDDPDPLTDLGGCDLLIVDDVQHLPPRLAGLFGRLVDDRTARRRATVVTAPAGPALLTALPRPAIPRRRGRRRGADCGVCAASQELAHDARYDPRGVVPAKNRRRCGQPAGHRDSSYR